MNDRTRLLVVVSLLHLINDANILLIPTVLPLILREFHLSYTQVGILLSSSIVLTIFLQSPLGYFSDIKGRRYLLSLGFLILGLGGILSSLAETFTQLLIAQLIIGLGGSFYHPLSYALTAISYESGGRGRSIGIQSSMGDIGVLLTFAVNGYIAPRLGWRTPLLLFGLVAIGGSILPLLVKEESPVDKNIASEKMNSQNIVSLIPILGIQFFLVAAYRVVYGYTSLILIEKGLELLLANLVIALLTLSGIVGSIAIGTLVDSYDARALISMLALIGILVVQILIHSSALLLAIVSVISLGFVIYGFYPCTYSLLADNVSKNVLGLAYGIMLSIGLVGGILGTILGGVLGDLYGLVLVPYLVVLFFIAILYLSLISKNIDIRKSVENSTNDLNTL
ncbi:MAG: MFS transporter [Candidatus Njordarchaeales archaeon]